jgi:hypothetical protein
MSSMICADEEEGHRFWQGLARPVGMERDLLEDFGPEVLRTQFQIHHPGSARAVEPQDLRPSGIGIASAIPDVSPIAQ